MYNDTTGSLQCNVTSSDRSGDENNTSILNKRGTSVEQDQSDNVAVNNLFLHDAEHAAK